jgi:hypothetical protein
VKGLSIVVAYVVEQSIPAAARRVEEAGEECAPWVPEARARSKALEREHEAGQAPHPTSKSKCH